MWRISGEDGLHIAEKTRREAFRRAYHVLALESAVGIARQSVRVCGQTPQGRPWAATYSVNAFLHVAAAAGALTEDAE